MFVKGFQWNSIKQIISFESETKNKVNLIIKTRYREKNIHNFSDEK